VPVSWVSEFAKWMIAMVATPIKFDDKTVETKANLSFSNTTEPYGDRNGGASLGPSRLAGDAILSASP
jgi:hypothetical protein